MVSGQNYETENKKQAAICVLSNYSQFVMASIGEGVSPHQLRLHLMKEISGMPSCLTANSGSAVRRGEASSSEEGLGPEALINRKS